MQSLGPAPGPPRLWRLRRNVRAQCMPYFRAAADLILPERRSAVYWHRACLSSEETIRWLCT